MPAIFERLTVDTCGNVMVCGYAGAARTDTGTVIQEMLSRNMAGEMRARKLGMNKNSAFRSLKTTLEQRLPRKIEGGENE